VIPGPRSWFVHQGNRAFTWLWWSQTVSLFGSQVTLIAIPLLAIYSLGADAFETGLLVAVETIPYLLFSLPAGVLADRLDRRRLLIVSNLVRAAFLVTIPLGAAGGWLSLPVLYAVAFGIGAVSVVFDVAYQSYVPELLEREQLLAGNQRIELSESAARTVGPTIGGALVTAFGGAIAILVDTVSYTIAGLALLGARRPRQAVARDTAQAGVEDDGQVEAAAGRSLDTVWDYVAVLEARITELERRLTALHQRRSRSAYGAFAGLGIVMRDRVLRDMAASTATFNLASSVIIAVLLLFAVRDVGMNPTAIGILIGGGNVGFVIGALVVGAVSARFGIGPTLVVSGLLGALATLLLPLATGASAMAMLLTGRFIGALAIPLFNVNARALRQSRAPREALGRVNAVFRLVDWGTLPVGALLGGWIGTVYGLRAALVLGAVLGIASAAWLVWSPLRSVRRLQAAADEAPLGEVPLGVETIRPDGDRQLLPGPALAPRTTPWALAALARLPTIRWAWLAVLGVMLQATLMLPLVATRLGPAAPVVYVASSLAVLACVLRNVRVPGLALVALGGISNLVAVIANGGYMPVSPEAARLAGHGPVTGYTNTVEKVGAVLQPLTDIFVVPAPLPLANVYSIGDLLIAGGVMVLVLWSLLRSAPPPAVPGGPPTESDQRWLVRRMGLGSAAANRSTLPPSTSAASPPAVPARRVGDAAKVAAGAYRPGQTRREAGTQSQGSSGEDRPAAGTAASSW
jgi:MFS family permease